jgi:DNA-directed RNA polymerase specialized sigma24 family protein
MSATQDVHALYERHYLSLVRLALHLVDDLGSAEDVVQDVFAALPANGLPRDPVRYLQRAVVNRARSVLRRRRVARTFLARPHSLDDAESADAARCASSAAARWSPPSPRCRDDSARSSCCATTRS